MEINKQILREINDLYFQMKKNDKERDTRILVKDFFRKEIIKELKRTNFLKLIKSIGGVKSAQLNIWTDTVNPNWKELELIIYSERRANEFDDHRDYLHYENKIRSQIYMLLDSYPNLNDFIAVYFER